METKTIYSHFDILYDIQKMVAMALITQKPKGWYSGTVDLWDLPKDRVYIDLKEPFKTQLINSVKRHIGNDSAIGNAIREPTHNVDGFLYKKYPKSLEFFEKIINVLEHRNVLEYNHDTVRRNVSLIKMANGKPIVNPKLPFQFNSEKGAMVISAVFHDGGLANPSNNTVGSCFHYRNYDNELIEYVVQTVKDVFGDMTIRYQKNHTAVFFPKIVGIILIHGIGLEPGHKNEVNPKIPDFIFNATNAIKSRFLQQAFDDDGCVEKWNKRGSGKQITLISSIDMSKYSPAFREKIKTSHDDKSASNIIKADKKLLNDLGIVVHGPRVKREYTTKKGKFRHSWKILISDKRNIKIFYEEIGFKLRHKQNRLKNMLESYKK